MAMEKVIVSGLALDKERDHPVVLLKSPDDGEVLPIWIGPAEASAIFTVLTGKSFDRPMTHDLMRIIVDILDAKVREVEITGINNNTYFARIVLSRGEDVFYIDARPSDSIALALRSKASIFVDSELFEKYKRHMTLKDGTEDGSLGDLGPEDLGGLDI